MTGNERRPPRPSATERQRQVWDDAAHRYDASMDFLDRTLFAGGRDWIGEHANGRVLEVAVGTGRNLAHYAPECAITGIDLSAGMLTVARTEADRLNRRVDLREADAANLPFADASFDTVVCALALCSIPSPAQAIAQMHRVLHPGGRLLLLDHVASTWPPIYAAQWLLEQITRRTAGEYFLRRQLPLVIAAGFTIADTQRLNAGTVERIYAVKP